MQINAAFNDAVKVAPASQGGYGKLAGVRGWSVKGGFGAVNARWVGYESGGLCDSPLVRRTPVERGV